MKLNWKRVALYVLRVIELIITGAAGGIGYGIAKKFLESCK